MGEMDEILKEFLVESYENLDVLDRDFVELEENPDDAERLISIFRMKPRAGPGRSGRTSAQ